MSRTNLSIKTALTVAGSDPTGGAGIQADLKAFAGSGVYGLSVISAITAQNSHGVHCVWALNGAQIAAQLARLNSDFAIHAMKTGMLANADVVDALVENLPKCALVVDPVLSASLGLDLLDVGGLRAAQRLLWPRALLLTPNIPEAESILGLRIADQTDMLRAARGFFDFGVSAVLIKGGHLPLSGSLPSECNDLLLVSAAAEPIWLSAKRISTKTHGTGCVFSALITAQLALGAQLVRAVQHAHSTLHSALAVAHPMGGRQRASPDVFSKDYTNADYDCLQG